MNAPKYLLIFFICIFLSATGDAQYSRFIVEFTDKNNSSYSLSNPSQYLSARAIARRTRYNISIDSIDLPVNDSYIQQVAAAGAVTFLSESKWLNQILILCNDSATINTIRNLSFVKKTSPVAPFRANNNNGVDKFKETVTSLSLTQKIHGEKDLSYGYSYSQIHIHEGEYLHNKGYTGSGMLIAMLDAGFNSYRTINAYDSARANGQFLGEKDFVAFDNSVNEDDTHGEYCLSTIAANVPGTMIGTAPKASFWLLRSENAPTEYPIEEHNWVAAAEFADSAGADLITSSLGYNQFDDPQFNHDYNDFYKNTTTVSQGATFAAKKGMIVTNSAGNEGDNSWKYIIFPADDDSVCSVGAVDTAGVIAFFSSYGYPGKVKPNVASVGLNTIIFGVFGAGSGSGTSFSNPNLNGLITCLWQAFPAYNNMTILNAVYQSADRFNNPDNRYGFGIPNMKTAYRILKKKQNIELYGTDWLFVTPDTFTNKIDIKLIGQVDGNATLNLLNDAGNIVASIKLITEVEEVYDTSFLNLGGLAPGNYSLQYVDSINNRIVPLFKTGQELNDWLEVFPVPFNMQLTAFLTAPETGNAVIRLIDARGRVIQTQELNVTEGSVYTIDFTNPSALAKGIYFVLYRGVKQHKTVKVLKQ